MTLMRAMAVLIVIPAVILGLTTATVTAQEKMADSRVQVVTKAELVRLDDVEGHTMTTFENKGYNLQGGSWTVNRGTNDLIKGNGTARGYTTTNYPDGAVSYSSWEGKTTTVVVDGKSIATSAGRGSSSPGLVNGRIERRAVRGNRRALETESASSNGKANGVRSGKKADIAERRAPKFPSAPVLPYTLRPSHPVCLTSSGVVGGIDIDVTRLHAHRYGGGSLRRSRRSRHFASRRLRSKFVVHQIRSQPPRRSTRMVSPTRTTIAVFVQILVSHGTPWKMSGPPHEASMTD